MASGDDISLARELGAMTQHLGNIDDKLGEILTQQKITNGRVNQHDQDIAVLKDRDDRNEQSNLQLHERVKDVEGRGRMWALGVGGPVAASLLLVLTGHG